MNKRSLSKMKAAAVLILLLALLLTAAFPAAAQVLSGRAGSAVREARRMESDRRKSELSPFNENGEIAPTKDYRYSPSDDFSTVRVLITTGSVSTIRFNVYGAYYIAQNDMPIEGSADSPVTVTVTASGGNVTATVGTQQLYRGSVIDIRRVTLAESGGYVQLRTSGNSNNDERKYLGDLRLSANSDGTVRFINVIPTAHYLYGIVPYEMSEGCNIEALKAQAVTAKTFAFAFPYGDDDYDISDSFNYQGYRGYNPGYNKCMQACLSTVGRILSYNNRIELTFYGATNGGETALPSHAFGYSPYDDMFEVKLDNIDFQYGSSKVKTLEITYGQSVSNSAFKRLLEAEAQSVVGHSVSVVSVLSADVNTPKFEGCVRNLTKMDATIRINDGGTERDISVRFDVTKLKSYGVFSASYKIYWGRSTSNGYNVFFCRWGHGLGLSQYGADGYAAEGSSYTQILNFYFRKYDLVQISESDPETALPITNDVAAYGTVNTNGTRMRTGPDTTYPIVAQFTAGTHADVITEANGWLLCSIGTRLGYIRGDLVDIVLFPAPEGGMQPIARGTVTAGTSGSVFRDGPSEYCNDVGIAANGTTVEVWHEIGGWYHVRAAGRFCYIPKADVFIYLRLIVDLSDGLISKFDPSLNPRP